MTLIQRQSAIVAVIQKLHLRQWPNPGLRSKAMRKLGEFNEKRMVFAGYTVKEAKASFLQCSDIALLNIAFNPEYTPTAKVQPTTKRKTRKS